MTWVARRVAIIAGLVIILDGTIDASGWAGVAEVIVGWLFVLIGLSAIRLGEGPFR